MGITLADALKQGATPVNPQQSASTNAYQSFLKGNVGHAATPQPAPTDNSPSYFESVAGGFKKAGEDLKSSVDKGPLQQFEAGFQAVGDVLKPSVVDPVNKALAPVGGALQKLNPVVDFLSGKSQGTTTTNQVQAQEKAAAAYDIWSKAHPEASKDLEALSNIGQAGVTIAGGTEAVKAAPEVLGKLTDAANTALPDLASKAEVASPEKTLAARVSDATPDYHKSMVSDYVQNAKGETVPRVNEGEGLTGQRTVNTSKSEAANGAELANIKNYPDTGTALEKSQAVHDQISSEATSLRSSLAAEDKANPLPVDVAKQQVYKNVFDNMNGDARNAFISSGKGLTGEAERAPSIVGRYGQDVAEQMGKYDGTRQGLLDLRQNLDNVYKDARGKSAFGSEHRNALDEMHSAVRDYINNELHTSTKSGDVQASFDRQSKLYRAKDVLDNKAEAEATSHYGRILQDHPTLRKVGNILSRQGIMVPLRIVEALAGVTALTAAARKIASGK